MGQVDVVAVAWRSSFERTAEMASVLLPSGAVRWGLDPDEKVFSAYEVPYQPVTVLVAQGVEIGRWLGAKPEADIREAMDNLAQYG